MGGPPDKFIAQVAGVLAADTVSFAVPASVRPGDSLIAVIAAPITLGGLDDPDDATWEVLATFAGATATTLVLRHIASAEDPATLAAVLDIAPASSVSALLVYRDLDPDAAIVGASFNNVSAATLFACPARELATYSDLYLGIVVITSALVGVTPPAGTTERHEHAGGAFELEVFELHTNTTGTTGNRTATTGANQSGMAASIALAAMPVVEAAQGLSFALSPVGTIGLPVEGV